MLSSLLSSLFFFFNDTPTTEIYTLSLHDALPICFHKQMDNRIKLLEEILSFRMQGVEFDNGDMYVDGKDRISSDRKSGSAGMPRPISYAVFCLKKKKRKARAREVHYREDSDLARW